jgi:uncharacterized protein involved in outer membrane biogenesis
MVFGGIAAALVVIVAAGVFFLLGSLDSLIKEAIEEYGPPIVQADVKLKEVEISATDGMGALRGLVIGNPKGFETPSAFELGEISLSLDVATVTEDVIVIKEINIKAPQVTYELGADGSNIDAIKRNVDSFVGPSAGGEQSASSDDGKGPKLVIEKLNITGGKVNVSATMLKGKTLSAPLPDIHLKDIGKDKGGASPGQVVERILASVKDGAGKAVGSLGLDKMLGSAKDAAAAAAAGAKDAAAGAADSATKAAGDAASGLKKMFGK